MSELSIHRSELIALPVPRVPINVRPGVLCDVPFMDSLQKLHTKQVGWMPTKQFEGKIKLGHVLIAEEVESDERRAMSGGVESGKRLAMNEDVTHRSSLSIHPSSRVGYCIGNDQYFKRDDVGIIYQMNVLPMKQRGLIGVTLLKAMFDRAAYGCKLFCCWCAQDIQANYFWESMGFVPLAFRSGSAKKSRTHIFWQRRIHAGDTTTPYWFPSQTNSGSIREDRLVLPIPPGTHWSDAKPVLLPQESAEVKVLSAERKTSTMPKPTQSSALSPGHSVSLGGLRFATPKPPEPEKKARPPKPKVKNDPKLVAAARELRDRWLEQVNGGRRLSGSPGKYDVSRSAALPEAKPVALLPAA